MGIGRGPMNTVVGRGSQKINLLWKSIPNFSVFLVEA